ncbi:MAG: M23 family metallopeptidase [Deltaproteobacteria bacterium]
MQDEHMTFLMVVPRRSGVRSVNLKFSHIKMAAGGLAAFVLLVFCFFIYTFSVYRDATDKAGSVNHLKSQINALNTNLNTNEAQKQDLRERFEEIEGKLLEMQELLDKKGIKNDLSVGGEFIPADKATSTYLDIMEKDIRSLFEAVQTLPIGRPMPGEINSGFGNRTDPFNSKPAFHSGIDIEAKLGDPIISTADGVVAQAGNYARYGETVIVKHKIGYKTLYGHLSKVGVKVGERVKSGDVIGYAGSTGRSTGVHLHYEVILNGKAVDPMKYLSLR